MRARRRRRGRGSSHHSRRNLLSEGLVRPLGHHGRLPLSVLCPLDVLIIQTLARYTPKRRLLGVLQRPLGPLRLECQVRGADTGAPVPGALGVALCRARGGQLVALPRGW